MTARTDLQSLELATLAISASLPATYDAAGYGATAITYTAVGKIEDHGTHGVKVNVSTFTPVDTGVTAKYKGSKDYGTKQLRIGYLPSDAGQVIIAAAVESKNHYSVKITAPTGDGESTGEIVYLDVLVTAYENVEGTVNDIRKLNVTFDICKKPVVVAAT